MQTRPRAIRAIRLMEAAVANSGRQREVSLVFTVVIIDNDDGFAGPIGLER